MSGHPIGRFTAVIEWAAFGIELLAVAVIVAAVVILAIRRGTVRYLFQLGSSEAYESYRNLLGRALLLALELMVAADLVRTVASDVTLQSVAVLGLLVAVRTLLGWGLSVEIEGCWPWQVRGHAKQKTETES